MGKLRAKSIGHLVWGWALVMAVLWRQYQRVSTDLESQAISFVKESQEMLLMVRKNDVYRPSCMTVVYFYWTNENTHSVHVITKWWWKGVGIGENYIMLNTIFWNWLGTLYYKYCPNSIVIANLVLLLLLLLLLLWPYTPANQIW